VSASPSVLAAAAGAVVAAGAVSAGAGAVVAAGAVGGAGAVVVGPAVFPLDLIFLTALPTALIAPGTR